MARDQIFVQYKVGDAVSMLHLHAERWDTFEIIDRTAKSVVLRDNKGRTHFADIMQLSDYFGACEVLDLPGYNAHFADESLQQHGDDEDEPETPKIGRPKRPDELIDKVRELAAQGKTRREIAVILEKSLSTVYHICRELGIKWEPEVRKGGRAERDAEYVETVRELVAQGKTQCAIADFLGTTQPNICEICRKHGIHRGGNQEKGRAPAEIPAELIARIRKLVAQGKSQRAVAVILRKSTVTISRICQAHGIYSENTANARNTTKRLEDKLPAIKRMIADGCTIIEIADACGASRHLMATFIAKQKLTTKPLQSALGEDKIEEVTMWRAQGMTTFEICKRLGVSASCLQIFMLQNGIK